MRRAVHAAPLLVAVSLVAGCTAGGPDVAEDEAAVDAGGPSELLVDGTLTACVAATPRLVEPGGSLGFEGYDVDVLAHVAAELQLELVLVEATYDDLVTGVALHTERCDVAAGGVVRDAALTAGVRTSVPYRWVERYVVVAGVDAAAGAQVPPGTVTGTVGVEQGGAARDVVEQLTAAEVVPYPSRRDLGRALGSGAVDAALVSVPGLAALDDQVGAVTVVASIGTGATTVLLLAPGVPDEVVRRIDDALAAFVTSAARDGARERWLGA